MFNSDNLTPGFRQFLFAVFFMLLMAVVFDVHANGTPQTPTSTSPTTSTSTSASDSASKSNADAKASQGQQQGQQANSGASITNTGSDSFRSSMWVLPAPVFTPPLPSISGCPGANVEQMAASIGWSFASIAKATVNSDNCTAITLYNSFVATCKWASAQQVLNLLSVKVLPGFKASNDLVLVDLDAAKCTALLAPVTNVTNRYETIMAAPVAPEVKPPACVASKPAKKGGKAKRVQGCRV